jgi:hypothetical protein
MPRVPIDYEKTVIYKIVCNDLSITECYVGHTTDFIRRRQNHKYNCTHENGGKHNLKIYKAIRDNEGWANWCMVIIEKYPCKDVFEACIRERYYYEKLHSSLNMKFPQRNMKEWCEMNKEKKNEYNKTYNLSYKEQIKERRNKLFVCECGLEMNHSSKYLHLKSKKHNDLMLCKNVTSVSDVIISS